MRVWVVGGSRTCDMKQRYMTSVRISSANWLYLNTLTSRWAESCVRGVVFVPGWVHHEQISLHLFLVSALFVVVLRVCSPICSFCVVVYTALLRRKIATHQIPSNRAVHRFSSDNLWSLPRTRPQTLREKTRSVRRRTGQAPRSPSPQGSVLLRAVWMDLFVVMAAHRGEAAKHFGVTFAPGGETDHFLKKCKFCRLCLVLCK